MPFPTTTLLDSFERAAENPLDSVLKSGNWKTCGWATSPGRLFSAVFGWVGVSETGAAYWTPATFANPAVCWSFDPETMTSTGRYVRVWCCIGTPTSATRNGYSASIESIPGGNTYNFRIEKWVAGTQTILASTTITLTVWRFLGITVAGGKVEGWVSTDNTPGNLASTISAADATFTTGSVGIEGNGIEDYGNKTFRAGEATPPKPEAAVALRTGARINTVSEGGKLPVTGNPVSMLL